MSELPRVLLLTNSLAVGGAETQLVRLAVHLRRSGYPVMVATILPDGEGRRELREAGIRHEVLPLRKPVGGITVMTGAIRLFRRWRPDVVISFLFYANVLARLAGAAVRIPAVVSSVRTVRFGGRVSDATLRLTDRLARVTVTNCRAVAHRLASDRLVADDRVRVIPNGIALDAFDGRPRREVVRRELGVSGGEFLWLAVGRLEPIKDYPTLLQAMAALREVRPPARLRIAAEGSQRPRLEALIRDLGLSETVRLLGSRDDVPELLTAADALVLTSLVEGLPNVVIEAMAAGLPVVATDGGGTKELVEPGVTGLLVPPRDPRGLAETMSELMHLPPGTRSAMGAAGRRFVTGRFAIHQVMPRWEDLIDELVRDRPLTRAGAATTSRRGGA